MRTKGFLPSLNHNIETSISDDDPEIKRELTTNVVNVEDVNNGNHKLITYFSE